MEQILDYPASSEKSLNYAGFWIRVGAYLIDAILLFALQFVLAYSFFGGYDFMVPNYTLTIIQSVIGIFYFVIMESSANQGTLGKMAVGIRVGDERGERISFANALGRYFAKILSAIILCIGYMMVGWDAKKQGLHDKLASTYVFMK